MTVLNAGMHLFKITRNIDKRNIDGTLKKMTEVYYDINVRYINVNRNNINLA